MTNYDKPYRGLPAEIRIQIWRLIIPTRATIKYIIPVSYNLLGRVQLLPEDDAIASDSPPFEHIKLLYLNREVYSELLPIFRATEIRFDARAVCQDYASRRIILAMQSPAFGMLNYHWNKTNPEDPHKELFLRQLLTLDPPYSPRTFTVTVAYAGRSKIIMEGDESVHNDPKTGFADYQVLALFAGAALTKDVVIERIIIAIEKIDRQNLPYWTPEYLGRYWDPPAQSRVGRLDSEFFLEAKKQ